MNIENISYDHTVTSDKKDKKVNYIVHKSIKITFQQNFKGHITLTNEGNSCPSLFFDFIVDPSGFKKVGQFIEYRSPDLSQRITFPINASIFYVRDNQIIFDKVTNNKLVKYAVLPISAVKHFNHNIGNNTYLLKDKDKKTLIFKNSSARVKVDFTWNTITYSDFNNNKAFGYSYRNAIGSPFDDTFIPDKYGNMIDGGPGNDTVSYDNSGNPVFIDLSKSVFKGGYAEGDVLKNIETIIGSDKNDTFIGNDQDNTFIGGSGNDLFISSPGSNTYDGSWGENTVDYSNSPKAIQIQAIDDEKGRRQKYTVFGKGGHAEGDKLDQIDRIIGTPFDDHFVTKWGIDSVETGFGNDYIKNIGGSCRYYLDFSSKNQNETKTIDLGQDRKRVAIAIRQKTPKTKNSIIKKIEIKGEPLEQRILVNGKVYPLKNGLNIIQQKNQIFHVNIPDAKWENKSDSYYQMTHDNREIFYRGIYDKHGQNTVDLSQTKTKSFANIRHDGRLYATFSEKDRKYAKSYLDEETKIENVTLGDGKQNTVLANHLDNVINGGKGNNFVFISDRHIQQNHDEYYKIQLEQKPGESQKISNPANYQKISHGSWGQDVFYRPQHTNRENIDVFAFDIEMTKGSKFVVKKSNGHLIIQYKLKNKNGLIYSSLTIAEHQKGRSLFFIRPRSKYTAQTIRKQFSKNISATKQKSLTDKRFDTSAHLENNSNIAYNIGGFDDRASHVTSIKSKNIKDIKAKDFIALAF